MLVDLIEEARRQVEVCNACRYCEGYCSVFPAITRERSFADADITQLANLCHNCRGCYYACQYTAPHEFDLNLPNALAEVRQESWKDLAWPSGFAKLFDRSGVAIALGLIACFVFLFLLAQSIKPDAGVDLSSVDLSPVDLSSTDSSAMGFYAYMSHGLMVTIFAPAFLLPLAAMGVSLTRYWRHVGGGRFSLSSLTGAVRSAMSLKNLGGGHGEGCNFESEDAYSNTRRWFHHATFYGFMMCFASTSIATIMHYVFALEAPYSLFSLPKLFGVPGGLLLCVGTAGLAWLKLKADPKLGAPKVWGGEMAFVLLLFSVSATGLALYAATGLSIVEVLLPIHLACVLTFFLLTPYSKMAHGFYRLAALTVDEARKG